MFDEDETKETLADEREDTWIELLSSLDTSKLDQNQNDLIDACGGIADYVDAFSMIQKQELIDRWLLEKRLNERGFRFAEISRVAAGETEKNQLRDQIQKRDILSLSRKK